MSDQRRLIHREEVTRDVDEEPRGHLWRVFLILAFLTLSVFVLYKASTILVPLAFAAIIAMLVYPIEKWLEQRMPPGVAIGLTTLAVFLVMSGILLAVGQQFSSFLSDWPTIEEKSAEMLDTIQEKLGTQFGVSVEKIDKEFDDQVDSAANGLGSQIGKWLGTFTSFLVNLLLFFVYIVLLLMQRDHLRNFVLMKTPERYHAWAKETMSNIQQVSSKYAKGRLILMAILFGVYIAGFYWAGLKYALVVAAIAALFSIIPYAGNILGFALAVGVSALSDDFGNTVLYVAITMTVAQLLENYVLQPFIVGDSVNINPLTTVIVVIAFGLIWGVGGAILAIPMTAIIRDILHAVPRGRPYAYLLGTEPSKDENNE